MFGRVSSILICVALLPVSTALAQSARVSMSASSSRVTVGEPFAIEIRADVTGSDVDEIEIPDFGALEVLGRRMSRPFSFSFGFGTSGQHANVQSQIIHSFTVRATAPGQYTIQPAIVEVGKRRFASAPLTIEAVGSALPSTSLPGAPQGGAMSGTPDDLARPPDGELTGATYDQNAFVRTVVDKAKVMVGEQVTVTVYLYVRGGLSEAPAVTQEPTADGFWVQDLLPPNRTLAPARQELNGRVFNVYVLRRFAGFALREGALQIGPTSIEIGGRPSLFDLLAGPSQAIRRAGVPVAVEAVPLPPHSNGKDPTFVGDLTLTASLDRSEARVGDALTLTLKASGHGNLKGLTLTPPTVDGLEILTPEVEDKLTTDLDQVGGERSFRFLAIARKAGSLRIGSVGVEVFDPSKQAFQRVATDALVLTVTGTVPAAASAAPDANEAPDSDMPRFSAVRSQSALLRKQAPLQDAPWFWLSVVAGPLLFAAARLTAATRRRLSAAHAEKRGERAFRSAQTALEAAQNAARSGDSKTAHAMIASALKAALEARLDEPVGGLTFPALRKYLASRGMSAPLAERIVGQLEALEASRFNPLSDGPAELETVLEKSRGVVRELEKFTPAEAP